MYTKYMIMGATLFTMRGMELHPWEVDYTHPDLPPLSLEEFPPYKHPFDPLQNIPMADPEGYEEVLDVAREMPPPSTEETTPETFPEESTKKRKSLTPPVNTAKRQKISLSPETAEAGNQKQRVIMQARREEKKQKFAYLDDQVPQLAKQYSVDPETILGTIKYLQRDGTRADEKLLEIEGGFKTLIEKYENILETMKKRKQAKSENKKEASRTEKFIASVVENIPEYSEEYAGMSTLSTEETTPETFPEERTKKRKSLTPPINTAKKQKISSPPESPESASADNEYSKLYMQKVRERRHQTFAPLVNQIPELAKEYDVDPKIILGTIKYLQLDGTRADEELLKIKGGFKKLIENYQNHLEAGKKKNQAWREKKKAEASGHAVRRKKVK